MKKKFDAVAVMREARAKLAEQWNDRPRREQINTLRKKHVAATTQRSRARQ